MRDANNVVEIRKAMKTAFSEVTTRVYYEDAPDEAVYPFIVFDLPDSNADGASTDIFDMYVNGWDDSTDTLILETLMFDVNEKIDNVVFSVGGTSLSFRATLNKKMNLNDADSRLKRREYRYEVRSIQRRL